MKSVRRNGNICKDTEEPPHKLSTGTAEKSTLDSVDQEEDYEEEEKVASKYYDETLLHPKESKNRTKRNRQKEAEQKRLKRLNETEEKRIERLKKSLESKRRALARETEAQRAQRLARNAKSARERKRRLRIENEEVLIEQRKRYAANIRSKRQNETEEERIDRLKRLAESKRNRIAKETEEQKIRRLERNKEWSRQKRLRLKLKREAMEEKQTQECMQISSTEKELIQSQKKKKSTKGVSGEMTTVTSEKRSKRLKSASERKQRKGIRNMDKMRRKRLQMKIQRDDMYQELETCEIASERIQNLILRTNRTSIRKILKYKAARVLLNMFLTDLANLNEEIVSIYKNFKQTVCEAVNNVFVSHRAGNKKVGNSYICSFCNQAFKNSTLLVQHMSFCTHGPLLYPNSSDNMSPTTTEEPEIIENKKFVCFTCEKKFATQLGVTIHQQQHNCSEHLCPVCHQVFDDMSLLKTHSLQMHTFDIQIESDEVVDEEVERAIHDLDFLDSKCCKSCSQSCFTQAQYGSHVLTEHPDNIELMNYCTFICSQCNEPFATRIGLEGHWTNICLAKWKDCGNSSNNIVVCGLCGLKFGNDKTLSSHKEIFHLEKTFTCEQCGNSFVDSIHLSMHKYNIHKTAQRFSCEICGKKFKHISRLSTHKATVHSVERSVECHICSKRFVNRSNLNNHLRIHAGNKPYKCNFCDKHYASLAARSVHELAHRGYDCKVCGKSFGTYFDLCSHRKLHRGNAEFKTEKSLSCEVCKKTFSKYVNMYQHMRNTHGPEVYVCDVCGKKYKSVTLLKSHKYVHDSWKGFGCSICGDTFRQRGNFYLHRKMHHKDLGAKLVILRKKGVQENAVVEKKSRPEILRVSDTVTSKEPIAENCNDNPEFVTIIPESTVKGQNIFDGSQNIILDDWQDFPVDDYSVEIEFEDDGISQLESQNEQISTVVPTEFSVQFSDFSSTIEFVSSSYIDFSRANVPLESIQQQTCGDNNSVCIGETRKDMETETELYINRNDEIENQEVVADSTATTNSSADMAMIKKEAKPKKLPGDCFDETMGCEIGADTINGVDDVQHENPENCMKARRFPLDPFSTQLIVKLTKMKTYNCVPCSTLFLTTKQLRSHQARISHKIAVVNNSKLIPSSYMCNYCGKEFVTKNEMREHDKMTNIQCKHCTRVYRNEQLLFKHYNHAHRKEKVFECEICQERFEVLSYLKHHKITVHLNKTDSNFNSATEETKNSKTDSEIKVRIVNIYTCVDCSQQFPGYKKYQEHRKTHKNLTSCSYCDSQFTSSLKLRKHCYKEHPGKNPFKCEMCPEFFKSPQSRKRHINKVHLDKPELNRRRKTVRDTNSTKDEMCDLCGKTFYSKSLVKLHFRDVHNERQFACDICNKKFRRVRDLDRHRVRHTGEREFLCSECGKAFFSAVELKCHVECVHANIRRSYVRRKCREMKYFCPQCPAKFAKESGIKLHMELHDPTRPYACDLCGLRYKFPNNVVTHKNYVHKEKATSESECVTTVQEC